MKDRNQFLIRRIGLAVVPALSWIIPLGAFGTASSPVAAQSHETDDYATFSSYIADVDGDRVDDYAVAAPYDYASWPYGAAIELYSGVNSRLIRTISPPSGDQFFGIAVVETGDADADGWNDIAIASFASNEQNPTADPTPVIRIYSSLTGAPLINIVAAIGENSPRPKIDMRGVGDLDGDQAVTRSDLAMLIADVFHGHPDKRNADIDGNGIVNMDDINVLATEVGTKRDLMVGDDLIELVMSGEQLVDSRDWQGTQVSQDQQPVVAGFIGCAWCMWRCGAGLFAASDCVSQYQAWLEQCLDNAAHDAWEMAECYRQRGGWIRRCLTKIGESIPGCARCIVKCAPKPTP